MAGLRKRPFHLRGKQDVTDNQLEKIFSHYDDRMLEIDKRRITQQSSIASDADAATIAAALNSLISALNASDLTNED